MVSWDPRGTNRSSPVECFTSDQAADQFWAGVSIPTTRAESKAYQRKTVELARRCGEVSGDLLDHITTADTARDLDALRRLVGDDKLTYVGLSYGTMIGQTYVNLFPDRVRAMVLDGIVDAVEYTTSAESEGRQPVRVLRRGLRPVRGAVRERLGAAPKPGHCALAGHGESVAHRVARVFATARQTPIPAPHSNPPGALSYGDLLLATFNPAADPRGLGPRSPRTSTPPPTATRPSWRTRRVPCERRLGSPAPTTSAAISCGDGPARRPSQAWPSVIPKLHRRRAACTDRCWDGGCGRPARRTGRHAAPIATPARGTPRPQTPILLMNNR